MAATLLSRGGLAIVQVDSEDSDDPHVAGFQNMQRDSISFVLLAPVGSGTQIFFTDRSWNGTSFAAAGGDGTYTWTAGADLPAGTVITISEAELTAAGMELADTGEAIYVYQGAADAPTTFLHALEYGDGNATFNGNLTNTGLINGTSAIALAADNVSFGERTWNHQASVLFQNINNTSNWHSNENSPHTDFVEGTNAHVAPDVQLWIAGISGGHGLFSVNGDATQNGGLGYNVAHHIQNSSVDGAGAPPSTTQRFWSPTHILFDTVAGKFFVVDSSGTFDRVLQGNISDLLNNPGTAPTMTILWQDGPWPPSSDGDGVTSIQLDRASGHVYFTANNDLLRVNYDSANQTAVNLADLGTDSDTGSNNWANELVLDLANGRAYIVSTETFSDFIEIPPGSGIPVFAVTTTQNSIHMVEGISSSDTNATGNTITELQFSGIYDETFNSASGGPDAGNFEDFYGKITDIDVAANGDIWFTAVQTNAGANGETGGIYRATRVGGDLTVTLISSETNATNRNYTHIHIDEETGYYYVTSVEPGESGAHAVYRGLLSSPPGTAPTLYADVGNINDMTPRDLTVESAPTLSGTAGVGLAVTEESTEANSGETGQVTLFSGITAGDIDTSGGDELAGATVRISTNFLRETSTIAGHAVSQDFLTINDATSGAIAGSGIGFSYDATTGVMTLTGAATVAEYAAALALVQFSTSGDNPTNYGSMPDRVISASVFDGLLHSDEITASVSVTGTNDEPVNTVPGEQTINEDNSRVFSTANSNALSVADADANPASQALQVTLSVTQGTLTLASTTGLSFSAGDGTGDTTMTFTGTANAINAALGTGLTFTPIADFNGSATLTVTVNDQGLNGTGGALSDSDTVTITINAVADIADDSGTTNEDNAVSVLVQGNDTFENTDHEITAFDQGSNGTVALDDNGTAADTTDDFLVYTPDADFNGSDSFTYTVTSGGVTETATVNVTITAVADIADDNVTVDEDSVDNAFDVLANDSFEDAGRSITSVGPASDGTVAIDDNGTVGDTTDDFVTYTPDGDFFGSDSFTYTVTSGGVTETATVFVTVDPINDAPTSTGLAGDVVTWTEGDPVVLLDDGGDATLADVDSADFDSGTLTVAITAGAVTAEDVLGIRNVGVGAGQIGVSGANVTFGGVTIGTFTGGSGGASLAITFNASASVAAVQELLRNVTYDNTGGNAPTDGDRTVSWTLVDGDGFANGGDDTLAFTSTVEVVGVDGAPVAVADGPSVDANVVTDIDVIANDTDADGGPKGVIEINGSVVSVGVPVVLASGASVTLNADGTIGYDPNGVFDYLVSPATALATGASNGSDGDSFSYTLNGGSSTTVSVTVLGVDEPGDELLGTPGVDAIIGTAGNDVIRGLASADLLAGGDGDDTIYGNNGSDVLFGGLGEDILYGSKGVDRLAGGQGADIMLGGEGADTYQISEAGDLVVENVEEGVDRVFARVDYTLTDNVENLRLIADARSGTGNELGNAIFGSGGDDTLFGLGASDTLRGLDGEDTLDGGDAADLLLGGLGADILLGGAGNDRLEGGLGTDTLTGGANRDMFVFRDGDSAATWVDADVVTDFDQGANEKLRLDPMDADTSTGGDQTFAFIGNGAFTGVAGELHYVQSGGTTYVEGDTDGDSTADFVIALTGTLNLVADDFVL